MAEATVGEIITEVLRTLEKAHANGERCFVAIRCSGNREVDHAREALMSAKAIFKWKSLPVAQLDPPDLVGYVVHHTEHLGPAFLAYGLPKGRDRGVLKACLELVNVAPEKFASQPHLMVLIATMEEIRDLTKQAPEFWGSRDRYLSWPVENADRAFLPAVPNRGMPARRAAGLAKRAAALAERGGGVAQSKDGVAGVGGGMSAAPEMTGFYGNPLMDGASDLSDEENLLTPWAGAPFREGDDIPEYIAKATPPVGRRWGRTLSPTDPEGANLLDKCRALLDQRQTEFARQGLAKGAKRFRNSNNAPATAEWYEQAIGIFEQVGDDAGVSDCCNMIGFLRFMHGDMDGAFSFFDRALICDESAEDDLRKASGYRRVGIIFEQRKEYNQALHLFERAGEIERKNNDRYAYSRSLHHQSRVAQKKDKYRDALELLKESLQIKEELEDEAGMATGYHELGNLQFVQRQLEEALEAYDTALELEERLQDISGIAVTTAQIGLVRKEMFHFADALRSFLIAKELFQRLQSPYAAALEKAANKARDMVDEDIFMSMTEEAYDYISALLAEEEA
jgi:tetratricopeptide (TPR) repeat protein